MKLQQFVRLLLVIATIAIVASNSRAQESAPLESSAPVQPAIQSSANPEAAGATPIYVRPTERQKLRIFRFDATGPYAFASVVATAAYQQHSDAPPEWGHDADSFGARVGSNAGIQLITVTTHYGLAEIVHEDVAYYPCGCTGFFPRLGHALISTVTARRGEDGHTTFSLSGIVAPYAGTMTALAWYPKRYGVKDGFRMGNYNFLGQAAWNLGFEFIYGGPRAVFGRNHVIRLPGDPRTSVSNN